MEQHTLPNEADYRAYDRVWRRVSPELDPYPEARAENERAAADERAGQAALLRLPGAESDPCCMGSEAEPSLEVLRGFLREELAAAAAYRAFARGRHEGAVRRVLLRAAQLADAHVRTLQAAHYLITGETYRISVCLPPPQRQSLCAALRARYHEAACGAFNYARAAEETEDACLRALFAGFSREDDRLAAQLRELLARLLAY